MSYYAFVQEYVEDTGRPYFQYRNRTQTGVLLAFTLAVGTTKTHKAKGQGYLKHVLKHQSRILFQELVYRGGFMCQSLIMQQFYSPDASERLRFWSTSCVGTFSL